MLDWPGKVAPTVFVAGCDFRCPYCHNPSLVSRGSGRGQWRSLCEYLRLRRSWIDGVVVTGGEPTDDPALVALLDAIAEESIPVKLDTNGSHPKLLGRLIAERLVQYVAVDIKTTFDRYEAATGRPDAAARVSETIALLSGADVPHEFRTTVYPGVVDPAALPLIAREIEGADLYAIQQFRPETTLDPTASAVAPVSPDVLAAAAAECSRYVPTITRGA